MEKHLRGMSEWAALYAVIIFLAGFGMIGLTIWSIVHVLF